MEKNAKQMQLSSNDSLRELGIILPKDILSADANRGGRRCVTTSYIRYSRQGAGKAGPTYRPELVISVEDFERVSQCLNVGRGDKVCLFPVNDKSNSNYGALAMWPNDGRAPANQIGNRSKKAGDDSKAAIVVGMRKAAISALEQIHGRHSKVYVTLGFMTVGHLPVALFIPNGVTEELS